MNALPPVTCRVCGTENRPTRLFCSNCGSYLQAEGEDTWEELPPRGVVTLVDPLPEPGRAPRATADGWSAQAAWNETPDAPPAGQPRRGGRIRAVGVVLLLLLLAVAAGLGALVYATLFSGGGADGGGGLATSTTAAVSTSSTTGAIPGSTTSAVSGTTLARGEPISPTSVAASSSLPSAGGITYGPDNLFDDFLETAWQEGADGSGEGEWVRFDFGREITLSAIEIANGYQKDTRRFAGNSRVETLRVEYSDGTTQQVRLYDDPGFQEVTPAQKQTQWLRLTILSVYPGDTWDDAGLSEVHLYDAAQ